MQTPSENDKIAGIALWQANTLLLRWDNNHATFAGLPEKMMDEMNVDGCPSMELGKHQGIDHIAQFTINQVAPGFIDFGIKEIGFNDNHDQVPYFQRIVYCGTFTIWWEWEDRDGKF